MKSMQACINARESGIAMPAMERVWKKGGGGEARKRILRARLLFWLLLLLMGRAAAEVKRYL